MILKTLILTYLIYLTFSLRHTYSPNVSREVASGIKEKLLQNLKSFSNQDLRKNLESDLNESDDSKRQLKSIDVLSAKQLFTIMKIEDPNCDKNGDGQINGTELKCFNIIWQYFVPS